MIEKNAFIALKVSLLTARVRVSNCRRFKFHKHKSTFHRRARRTRFPSSLCASTTKIIRLLESTVETQPQLQPALLRLVYDVMQGRRAK